MGKVGVTVITLEEQLPEDFEITPEEMEVAKQTMKAAMEHMVAVDATVTVTVEVKDTEEAPQKMVTISEYEYNELLNDSQFLNCLQDVGVDNWSGYSEAHQMMREGEEE